MGSLPFTKRLAHATGGSDGNDKFSMDLRAGTKFTTA